MSDLYSVDDYEREGPDEGRSSPWRSPFMRDFGRVVHSAAFRRLQGKTQVFPGHESDFFRNRLTHSLEVAQIAEGIAERLNYVNPFFEKNNISGRLCAAASLVHDLGHPPFGHNGERALDDAMRKHGGFEGNAQTLRIVARIEKKVQDGNGASYGLNLTFRSLAAILKYDRPIPRARRPDRKLVKGFYLTELGLVTKIKQAVTGSRQPLNKGEFKTLECSIMDIADDIAYSTYDLEDSLKAGFLTPASILSSSDAILEEVAKKVSTELKKPFFAKDVLNVLVDLFDNIAGTKSGDSEGIVDLDPLSAFVQRYRASHGLASDGRLRTQLSSQLIGEGIDAVDVEINEEIPALSRVKLSAVAHAKIEVLKQYTYITTIFSSRVSLPEFRGYEVVQGIFQALSGPRGYLLMPDDIRSLHASCDGDLDLQMRIVCDFVAGMTDRYAMEFFGRLHSDTAQSMFKPV
jgi:dGTPase